MSDQQQPSDASRIDLILNRRSVRDYTPEPVSEALLDRLLRAGMSAPTAKNTQPWSFVVVTGRQALDQLAEGLPFGKMLPKAQAAIVVCAMPELANNRSPELAVVDATCASQNILLAAEALGLGSVWVAAYPYDDRMAHVAAVLGIPREVLPLCVLPLGYPVAIKPPIDKYKPERIHHGRW